MDIPYNDKKIRNIQCICLRNLFYETNEHPNFGRIKPRRSTIFQILDYSEDYSKLLKFNEKFLLTCFFSLHHKSGELIYVSEISKLNSNPNFNSFVLPNNKLNKLDHLIIKVWVKFNDWKLLIRWDCDLSQLSYIEDLEGIEYPNNTIIIRLHDRYYYKKTGAQEIVRKSKHSMSNHKLPSYTFDMIRSINNLDRSIKELNHSKRQISQQIDKIDRKDDIESIYNKIFQTQITIDDIERRISKQKLINDELLSEIMKFKIFNNKIDDIKNDNLQFVHNFNNEIELIKSQIPTIHQSIQETNHLIKEFFKSFSLVLNELLPISQSDMYSLRIEEVEFPPNINKTLNLLYHNDENILRINTGINYITQMVMILLKITKVPVYYHIVFKGNYSIIKDFKDQEFPLFYDPTLTKKKNEFRNGVNEIVLKNELFETGLNLLNKNLLLVCKQLNDLYNQDLMDNIPIDCLDNFLWILQYLILFLTADDVE